MALDKVLVNKLVKGKLGLKYSETDPVTGDVKVIVYDLQDPIIDAAIDEAEELVMNYINRKEFPSACLMTLVSIACDIYKYNIMAFEIGVPKTGDTEAESDYIANVSEIKVDDLSVRDDITGAKYSRDSGAISALANKEVDFLKDYRGRLHRFRLMQWRKWDEGM